VKPLHLHLPPNPTLRILCWGLLGLVAVLLGGCGFALRSPPQLAFSSVYVQASDSSLVVQIKRTLQGQGLQVLQDTQQHKEADAVLEILAQEKTQQAVGTNAAGQVRELQLRMRVRYKMRTLAGKVLLPETGLEQTRDVSFNETEALSKEIEINTLYRDMQNDIVMQLMRRLATVRVP
jgi:LPS-assembly lipoprotein